MAGSTGASGGAGQDPRLAQAIALHQAGRLGDAIKLYRQALGANPRSVPALTYCGAAFLGLGRAKEAAAILQAALSVNPENPDALLYLGNAQQMTGQLAGAEASYAKALEIRPGNAQAQNNLGVLLQRRGDNAAAAERFRKAAGIEPGYAQAHNNLAQALAALGETGDAIAAGERAVAADPQMAEAHNTLGSALSNAGRHDEACAAFRRALEIRPNLLEALTNLAVAEIIAGRPAEAVVAADRALEIDPCSVSALASKSVALAEAGDLEAHHALVGLDTYIKTLEIVPGPAFADLDAFNAALVAHILAHPTLKYEPRGYATRNGRHTGGLLEGPRGPLETFEEIVHREVERYIAELPQESDHPVVTTAPGNWQLRAWSVVMEEAGHQIPHIHESGWLSGVYYPKIPSDIGPSEDDPSGWIEFGEPQELYRVSKSPPLRLIRPAEGRMVLFPSYLFHRTVPTRSEEMRVSIAFDVVRAD